MTKKNNKTVNLKRVAREVERLEKKANALRGKAATQKKSKAQA